MSTQPVALGNAGVVEVIHRMVGHPQFLHDPPGSPVVDAGERDDFTETEGLEAETQRGPGGLGGVAETPVMMRQPPAHLHGRSEMGPECRTAETDETNE